MPISKIEDITKLLSLVDMCADSKYGDLQNTLMWRTDGEYAPVTFFINCNDLFYWGCSDCEEITAQDMPNLDKCFEDIRTTTNVNDPKKLKFPHGDTKENIEAWCKYHDRWWNMSSLAPTLWCCRQRKMRPQIPYYELIPKELHDLFNACGPERTAEECG